MRWRSTPVIIAALARVLTCRGALAVVLTGAVIEVGHAQARLVAKAIQGADLAGQVAGADQGKAGDGVDPSGDLGVGQQALTAPLQRLDVAATARNRSVKIIRRSRLHTEPLSRGRAPSQMTSADDAGRQGRDFKSSESAWLTTDPESHTVVINARVSLSGPYGYLQI